MLASLKTDPTLIQKLEDSAKKRKTKGSLVKQRVSFVYGNLPQDSSITREEVAARILQKEGA